MRIKLDSVLTFSTTLVLIVAKQIFASSNSTMYAVTRQLIYPAYSLKVEIGPSLRLKSPSVKFVAPIATVNAPLSVTETGGEPVKLNKGIC